MGRRSLQILALYGCALFGRAAAETIVIRPDPCPAPAEAPRIVGLVDGADLYPSWRLRDDIVVLYLFRDEGWARRRLLARFELEAATGNAALCASGNKPTPR